jgi:predicted CoA-binding protein
MNDPITELLKNSKTIAVVGLSSKRQRPSFGVAEYMQSSGYRIFPVNPDEQEVLGETAFAHLQQVPQPVDIVNVFRRSEFVTELALQAVKISARALWLQEGVINHAAEEYARQAGLLVFSNLCILKEHVKRFRLRG